MSYLCFLRGGGGGGSSSSLNWLDAVKVIFFVTASRRSPGELVKVPINAAVGAGPHITTRPLFYWPGKLLLHNNGTRQPAGA